MASLFWVDAEKIGVINSKKWCLAASTTLNPTRNTHNGLLWSIKVVSSMFCLNKVFKLAQIVVDRAHAVGWIGLGSGWLSQ